MTDQQVTINQVMKDLQAYYKAYNLNPDYIRVYKRVLGQVDPKDLQEAADIWMGEADYNFKFPQAGDLKKIIVGLADRRAQKRYDDQASNPRLNYWAAMSAWHEVLDGSLPEEALYRWPVTFMREHPKVDYQPPAMSDEEVDFRYTFMDWVTPTKDRSVLDA